MSLLYVVGHDGSDAARAALRVAAQIARPTGARLVAAHVYPRPPLGELAERMLAEIDEPEVERSAIVADSPAHGLQQLAEAEGAALIAVGVTHHGPLGRLVPGSVGEHLLHGAPCPVMATPPSAGAEIRVVGVAYDGRREAESALRTATGLARRLGARLVLIGASGPDLRGPVTLPGMYLALRAADRRDADGGLQRAVEALPRGVEAEARPVGGPAGPSIVAACHDDVDLLVCGSRAYGPVRSVLLGSVSRHLVDHAPCPVVVIPRGVDAELDRSHERAASGVG